MSLPLTVGTRQGKLVYLGPSAPTRFERDRTPRGLWRCDCGKTARIRIYAVSSGRTRSCGCATQEAMRGWMQSYRSELEAGAKGRR